MSADNPHDVQVGQVWEDCDWRRAGRKVKILTIENGKAVVQSTRGLGGKTRIRLNRFRPTSTGYRLVT